MELEKLPHFQIKNFLEKLTLLKIPKAETLNIKSFYVQHTSGSI
jgi:hypothetical protein